MKFPSKCTFLALAVLCAMGTSVEVHAQRFFFAHPGDNPFTSQVEQAGQEISGTLAIPTIGHSFRVQIWFEAGPYWSGRYNAFYPFIGYDKSWTDGQNAYRIDKKLRPLTTDPIGSISNLGSFSLYPGPGTRNLNFLTPNQLNRGGRSPRPGTNNPFGDTATSLRPYGTNIALMTAYFDGVNFYNYAAALNAGEQMRICDFTLVNQNIATGDTYGDLNGDREMGLILYKCASDSWNGTRLATSVVGRFNNLSPVDGSRIAVKAYASGGVVPEPGTVLILSLGASWLVGRRRRR